MAMFGRGKKRKKGGKKKHLEGRRRFAEIEDYEDEEYYGEDESAEYGDDGYYEEDGYYGDDEAGEEEYYEGDAEEYYEEEYYGDDVDYYEDNSGYETDGEEDEDEDDDEEDEDLYYIDDGEYEDDDDDEDDFVAYRRKRGVAAAFLAFRNLPLIDKVIAFTGVAVLIFAVLTGAVFMASKKEDKAVAAFAEVGNSLMGIGIIGESGLLAVADAQLNKVEAAEEAAGEATPTVEEPVEQPKEGIDVVIKMTSIVKDLKIKFLNQKTDKLVANVPFEVELTAPDGKAAVWKDDDKDGIIYQENIASGAYKVRMLPLAGFADYKFSTESRSVDVKADIAYKKVDVKEEIKTEAEVNAAVEDTVVAEVVEESKLTDTLPFVASTATKGTAAYREIDKGTIADPATVASAVRGAAYYVMTEKNPADASGDDPPKTDVTDGEAQKPADQPADPPKQEESVPPPALSISDASVEVGKEATLTITKKENVEKIEWSSSDESKAKVDASGKVTGVAQGEVTITAIGANKKGEKITTTCTVKVTAAPVAPTLKIDHATLSLTVGESGTIKAESNQEKVSWETAGQELADVSLSADGKTVTIKAKKAGTVTLKATVKDLQPQTCTVTIAEKAANRYESDTTSLLKDREGRQVFVQQGDGQYRQAKYADYYDGNIKKFYIEETTTLYTGWQNINGKTYYYLADHRVATGEQIIQGAKYNFASDGSLVTSSGAFGIDVSKWNGNIDWNSVRSSGAAYAIIRCGYRGSKSGAMITDPKFAANIAGAAAAGLKTGVYFFSQAVNEKEAVEEASMVLDLVKKYAISYPIFLDVESSGGRADKIDKATRTAVCKAFCATIQDSGYTAGIYANKTWLNEKMDAGVLGKYKIWLAQYAAAPSYGGRYDMWQYSAKGSVPGIGGNVDLNLSYLGY